MTFAAALRKFFPASDGVTAKELADFMKACSPADKEQYAKELTDILGEPVVLAAQ